MSYLAADLGANGGKVYLGRFDDDRLTVEEVHRFDNRPVERDGRYVWDVDRLVAGVEAGIREGVERAGSLDSVGVDTWGLDFGLVADGHLLRDPYAYRDPTLTSTLEDLLTTVDRREVFEATGINHWNTPNTLWQYHYLSREEPGLLDRADTLLLMPQLLAWRLGGEPCAEETIASTTQMVDPDGRTWARPLLDRLDLPTGPLPDVRPPGTTVGAVDIDHPGVDADDPPDLVLPGSHDTASAVVGLPLGPDSRAFLSTGTWFIAGVERAEPDRSAAAFDVGASNELGVDGTVRFLKNVNGFFLLEECREAWRERGRSHDYDDLLAAASGTDPVGPLVNPDDPLFGIEGAMPDHVATYCRETGQAVPDTPGEVTRCILESLAAKTALVLEDLLDVAGAGSERLHLGGGGVRNEPFCRMLADAAERRVGAGPAEATAVGNVVTQAWADGRVDTIQEGRDLVRDSLDPATYDPDPDRAPEWADARDRMRELTAGTVGE